jgi:4-amino-4-deoxy-L-arabinose transferase-like glycosyltransferase
MNRKQCLAIAMAITVTAVTFRLALVSTVAMEDDDDGHYYAQIADNLLDGHGYSGESEPPFVPTLVRVPGYPVFLAGVFALFGRNNFFAVRLAQTALDTVTCWLVAALVLLWAPPGWLLERRRKAGLVALGLYALCPFTAIYVTTLLTESLAIFLSTSFVGVASLALTSEKNRLWFAAGLLGGAAAMVRPDTALFVGAIGVVALLSARERPGQLLKRLARCVVLSLTFVAVLTPWTVRNAIAFRVFQPAAPLYANAPDEFVPRGYIAWLRTWVDDERYVSPFEDSVDLFPIDPGCLPHKAFDNPEERERVLGLFFRYNNAPPPEDALEDDGDSNASDVPEPNHEAASFVRMTPEIDGGFGQLADERIHRAPTRYYLSLPMLRALSLWFDSHSQYYPFQGEVFPLYDLDTNKHQQYWLSGFLLLLWGYTLLGSGGVAVLMRDSSSSRWFVLLALLILPRLAFLSWQEHPEARYTVEFFPLVIAAAGLASAQLPRFGRLMKQVFRKTF